MGLVESTRKVPQARGWAVAERGRRMWPWNRQNLSTQDWTGGKTSYSMPQSQVPRSSTKSSLAVFYRASAPPNLLNPQTLRIDLPKFTSLVSYTLGPMPLPHQHSTAPTSQPSNCIRFKQFRCKSETMKTLFWNACFSQHYNFSCFSSNAPHRFSSACLTELFPMAPVSLWSFAQPKGSLGRTTSSPFT